MVRRLAQSRAGRRISVLKESPINARRAASCVAWSLALFTGTTACESETAQPLPADAGRADQGVTADSGPMGDAGPTADAAPPITGVDDFPGGCRADSACDGAQCTLGVCVPTPPSERPAEYSCEDAPRPGTQPNLSCWYTPPPLADGPAQVPARGLVEFFGEGDKTIGLRVRLYDYGTFDPSACQTAGQGERTVAAAREAVERCLDTQLDDNPATAPLADTVSVECDPPQADSGCWSVDALPTGKALVARITGDINDWVPTYQYGLFINPCETGAARFDSGVCPETVVPDPSEHDWACDLVTEASPFHGAQADGTYWFRNLSVISQRTWDSFPQTAGEVRINQGFGAVAGRLYDCDGRSVVNATFGLAVPGRRDTYFNGIAADTLPSPGRTTTNLLGTYANLNTPPGANGMVAVARTADAVQVVAFERFFLLPDTVTIVNPTGRRPVQVAPPY